LLLAHVAALAAATSGCSDDLTCNYSPAPSKTISVTSAVACNLAVGTNWSVTSTVVDACVVPEVTVLPTVFTDACQAACGGTYNACVLPDAYLNAYVAAQTGPALQSECPDAGAPDDALPAVGATRIEPPVEGDAACPAFPGEVSVTCRDIGRCTGRWTAGIAAPALSSNGRSIGEYFARAAYFEGASVHAFERLAAELTVHAAPAHLVNAARRAADDERRHARSMEALARRFDVEPTWPEGPQLPARTLLDMACENVAEGCVRETYGAVLGLMSANRAADPEVRATMRPIAEEECQHADLSWRVAAWTATRLDDAGQKAVSRAMAEAAANLLSEGGDEAPAVAGMPSVAERRRVAQMLQDALFRDSVTLNRVRSALEPDSVALNRVGSALERIRPS
jgi:hypothetical protein